MKQPCIKVCSWCGNNFEKKVHNATTCGRKCSVSKYTHSDKAKLASKRSYEKQKEKGTLYYKTDIGKEKNIIRSKKYRLLHPEVKDYKKTKAREYAKRNKDIQGTVISPERMKKVVKLTRLYQRLRRQSIKSSKGSGTKDFTKKDFETLELDIKELKEKKVRLENLL